MLRLRKLVICFSVIVTFAAAAQGQNLPKVRAAYTSIGIQFDPVYIMKELNLPRKYGLDVDVLFVPVSSRAIQAALAGEIQFITSGGVANINANVTGADFVGLTATLSELLTTFRQLASDVDDTAMAVGSDTMSAAARLYGYVKVGAKDNPGLKPIAEQLGKAFQRANVKPTPPLTEKK